MPTNNRSDANLESDEEREVRLEMQQEQEAFNRFQAEQLERNMVEEDQAEEEEGEGEDDDDESGEENTMAARNISSKKTPFRAFRARSRQAIALLKAMLLQSPFDKNNGHKVPDRWQKVVDVLIQTGEAGLCPGNRNEYEHVTTWACRLAWDRFKEAHHNHLKAQSRLTGAIDNDEWEDLVHSVIELEEVEEECKKSAASNKKRSAELQEQSNRDGAMLVEASLQRISRAHNTSTESSVSEDSGTDRGRPRA